jgi:Sphingosine kinase and enzymes related to eukaryotic diacylglycerol kinase
LEKCKQIFEQYDYKYTYMETKYREHAEEIVENLKKVDLVITIGGDGTFNEAVSGNLKRKEQLVLSHIPAGTTNDLGAVFCLGHNVVQNLNDILDGAICDIDICTINNKPFVYVGGLGKFMNIPYETTRNEKRKFGYVAYIFNGIKDFFNGKTNLYELTYEIDNQKYNDICSIILISNANQIAGIKKFYKDVKINDNKFEVLLCSLKSKKEILGGLFAITSMDVTKAQGFKFFKTDNLKIYFRSCSKKIWCLDGEKYESDEVEYEIKIDKKLKMLLPKKAIEKGNMIL